MTDYMEIDMDDDWWKMMQGVFKDEKRLRREVQMSDSGDLHGVFNKMFNGECPMRCSDELKALLVLYEKELEDNVKKMNQCGGLVGYMRSFVNAWDKVCELNLNIERLKRKLPCDDEVEE